MNEANCNGEILLQFIESFGGRSIYAVDSLARFRSEHRKLKCEANKSRKRRNKLNLKIIARAKLKRKSTKSFFSFPRHYERRFFFSGTSTSKRKQHEWDKKYFAGLAWLGSLPKMKKYTNKKSLTFGFASCSRESCDFCKRREKTGIHQYEVLRISE